MSLRYMLVANPTARSGKAKQRIDDTLAVMRERGMDVEFVPTRPDGQTIPDVACRLAGDDCDVVVSMGGDGTFREVGAAVVQSSAGVKMGMIPAGTANNQGKSFGVSARPEALSRNLDVLEAGWTVDLDAGVVRRLDPEGSPVGEALFFDSVGWGLQPDILRERNADRDVVESVPLLKEIYRDQAVYAGALMKRFLASLVEPVEFEAHIETPDGTVEYLGLTDLIITATPVYAGEWVLNRDTEPDDGQFEVVPMAGRRDWFSKALRDLKAVPVWQEQLDLLGVTHAEGFAASRFRVTLLRPELGPVRCQIDGEEWQAGDSYEVEVMPGAVPLIVPEDFAPPWRIDRF